MKRRILPLLLAFLMVVSMIPASAFATEGEEAVTEPTTVVDNCPYCEETTAEDGTVTHANGCNAAYVYDGSVDVHKYAQLIQETDYYFVSDSSCSDAYGGFYYSEFEEGTIFYITGWYWDPATTALWYQVEFYSGGVVAEVAEYWPAEAWILQDYTDTTYEYEASLEFMSTCDTCGKPDCSGEHGKEASDPSNTVTVQGALPGDATVTFTGVTDSAILAELGIKGGFAADISVLSNGAVWQPDGTVTITLKVDGDYPVITHYLDDVDAVTAGIADGSAMVMDVSAKSDALKQLLASAIAGYQAATNTTEQKVAVEWIYNAQDNGDGTISFKSDSLSLYTANEAGYFTEIEGSIITKPSVSMTNQLWDGVDYNEVKVIFLGNYKVTPGETITLTDGNVKSTAWSLSENGVGKSSFGSYPSWPQTITGDYSTLANAYHSYDATLSVDSDAPAGTVLQVNMVGDDGWTYYVKFTVVENVITVTFNPNGGSVSTTSEQTAPGTTIALPTPTRDGYLFGGWSDGTTTHNGTYTAPNSDVTLTAQWAEAVNITFVGNGGTVNGVNTYVMPAAIGTTITLPVATQDGMYFDGWYTEPDGGTRVGVLDITESVAQFVTLENLIYDYTVPNTDTILYARWTDRPELASGKNFIMIGLINNYYREYETDDDGNIKIDEAGNKIKRQYQYTIGYDTAGKDIYAYSDSYHQFPKEPAKVAHKDQYRPTNTSGSWQIIQDTGSYPLLGSPADYVDPSIFNSTQYVPGADEKTMGVFDSQAVGDLVNSFLIDGTINSEAIIRGWLQVLKVGTDNVTKEVKADIKAYYGIDIDTKSVDAMIADGDFKLVPYVLKHHANQNNHDIGWWVIDMIILPARTYTLTYNMALPAGYTTTAIPPQTAVYKAGDDASVLDGPPADYVPTKVVDGVEYTATFLYWTDESGNKYGAGQPNDSILMDSDKVLTAYWSTNEKDPGSLKITKKVTAVDGNLLPAETPTFTFTYSIDKSTCIEGATNTTGSYSYTVYNAGGIVQSSNTLSLVDNLSGTFQLQNGWYIVMTDLPAGAKVTVSETVVPPYIPDPSSLTMTIHAIQETSATFFNAYPRVYYTVEHYLQNDDGTYRLADTEQLVGTVGEQTKAVAKTTYTDYTLSEIKNQFNEDGSLKQETISADGSTVVKIYYDLIPVTGNLTVSKTVTASGSWSSDAFAFTVTGTGLAPGTYAVTIGSAQQQITVGDDGKLSMSVSIAVSAVNTKTSLTISGLPVGSYTVTETAKTGYIADKTTASVSVTENATEEASFTNEYKPASLTVRKTVTGISTTQKFTFTVTFGDGSAQTFELTDGETKTFDNIPLGEYTVTEQAAGAGYATTATGEKGNAVAGGSYTAVFTNDYAPAKLTISKTVVSANPTAYNAPVDQPFTFTVVFSDSKAYTYTKGDQSIQLDSGGTLTLKHGESAVFENLPVGITYKVTEQTPPDYFTANKNSFSDTTTRGGNHTAAFTNTYTLPETFYTVQYLEQGTTNQLAPAKTVTGKLVTSEVTENAIGINNYTLVGDSSKSIVLKADATKNVIIFYYTRDTGSLSITKNVDVVETGTNTPEVVDFQFTIAFPTDVTPAASYNYGVKDKAGNVVQDENGSNVWTAVVSGTSMVIHLEDGQTANFTGLPTGSYTVTETDYSAQGYDSNYSVNGAAAYTKGRAADVTVVKNETASVEFQNKFPVGDLVIEKTVTKEFYGTDWNGDTFTFTVERTTQGRPLIQNNQYVVYLDGVRQANPAVVDANGNLTVTISFNAEDAAKLDEESEKDHSVAHTLTIENLPAGTYSVTEDANTAYTQTPVGLTQSSLTIPAETTKAEFGNRLIRKTGNLSLEKELTVLEGYNPPSEVTKFSFTIELLEDVPAEDKTFTVAYSLNQYADQTATDTSVTMSQGEFTVTLEANQKVTINGLPEGEYRITEATVPYYANAFAHKENGSWVAQNSTTTNDGQLYTEIEVPANGTAEVKCTNTYPVDRAELVIQKLVTKKYERDTLPTQTFTFTVTMTEEDVGITNYDYKVYNADGKEDTASSGKAPVTNNAFTVTLKAGQYVVIPSMPVCGYTVSENVNTTDYNASYKVYVSDTGEGASTQVNTAGTVNASGTGGSVSRTFSAGKTDTVVFTNEYKQHLGTLTITKTVKTVVGGSADDTFIFHIKGTDTSNSYIDMDVTITGSDSITIYDLPLGNYTVTEDTDWSWRYTAASDSASASLAVDDLSKTVTFTNTYAETKWLNDLAVLPNVFGKKENE